MCIMDWTLLYLVWFTLITASSSRSNNHDTSSTQPVHEQIKLPNTSRELYQDHLAGQQTRKLPENSRELQGDVAGQRTRKLPENSHELYQDEIAGQQTRRLPENSHELYEDDIAQHRTSESPLPFYDGIQMIQELERLRLKLNPVENRVPRVENRTFKVINNFSSVHLASRRGLTDEQPKAQDVVVFPGPTSKSPFMPRIPEECLRMGICEDVPDYPEERVASIIENLGDAKDKYKVDELDTPEIAQRIGPPEEMELCDFALKVVIPKAAPDKDGVWHYILNQKDKPLQGFHVEICREDRSPCAKLVHFYSGYEATCKQKYVLRYMAGLNENGEIVEKPFKLPSCCSCVVRQID